MKRILLFSISSLLLFSNCTENDTTTNNWFFFMETQCENPWGVGQESPDADVIVSIESYLGDLGVNVLETTIEDNFGPVISCAACECPSGRGIHIKANSSYESILFDEGFVYY